MQVFKRRGQTKAEKKTEMIRGWSYTIRRRP